jgi:hypothetical protein
MPLPKKSWFSVLIDVPPRSVRHCLMRLCAKLLLQEADLRTVVADHDVDLGRGLLQEDVDGRREVQCDVDALAPGLKLACHGV